MGSKNKLWVLLSPPGVFGGVETGQVFVVFDDIHLFTGPTKQKKSYYDSDEKVSPSTYSTQKMGHKISGRPSFEHYLKETFSSTAEKKNDNQWLSMSQSMLALYEVTK